MIRATLDVNVLVSGFPQSTGVPGELIELWLRGCFDLVLSEHILAELADVWSRPYWRTRYHAYEVQRAIALLGARASIVEPTDDVHRVAVDEEDDLVLATAIAGRAQYLVTGDRPLQALGRYRGVTILSPRQFLDILESGDPQAH